MRVQCACLFGKLTRFHHSNAQTRYTNVSRHLSTGRRNSGMNTALSKNSDTVLQFHKLFRSHLDRLTLSTLVRRYNLRVRSAQRSDFQTWHNSTALTRILLTCAFPELEAESYETSRTISGMIGSALEVRLLFISTS